MLAGVMILCLRRSRPTLTLTLRSTRLTSLIPELSSLVKGCILDNDNMASHQSQLHRSRSTTSVKERRKNPIPASPQNADEAKAHALIAAHRAMGRSQSRSSAPLHRADSGISRRSNETVQQVQFSPATQLRRQRSVLQSKAPHLAAALQVPYQSRSGPNYTESDLTEFGPVGETYGAEPSSYRRIRRTKSLLTPRRRLLSPHTSLTHGHTLRQSSSIRNLNIDNAPESGLGLRIRKSFNFLRPSSRADTPHQQQSGLDTSDGALHTASSNYLDCMPQPIPERKPSLLLQKLRRPRKTLRSSVRSHAFDSPSTSNASDTALIEVTPKRTFSGSLRNRFFKVFSKSVSSKPSLPIQQLEASRRHFGMDPDDHEHSTSFDDYHVDEDDERRQSFYVPSKPGDLEEELDRFSHAMDAANSHESLHSNGRSRVTSWTNSTSTTASTSRPGALQQNRLSIIKEDGGPHQPSSSAGRHIGGIGGFQDPLPSTDENGRLLPTVDGQRIYSALVKRIAEEEVEMEQTKAALHEINQNTIVNSKRHEDEGPFSTIRAVSRSTQYSSDLDDDDSDDTQQPAVLGITPLQHQANVVRRREELVEQQEQQSFFPFSSQYKRSTPSPFRQLLDDRKSQDRLRSTDEADNAATITVSRDRDNVYPTSRRVVLSSESVYSTTTNGGVNEDFVPPISSSDNLGDPERGMATIIAPPETDAGAFITVPTSSNSSEPEWKGWIQGQVDTLIRSDSKASGHVREHAQIDPEDVSLGFNDTIRPPSRMGPVKRFLPLDLKEVPSHHTPIPRRNSSLTKSQSGLLKRSSINTLMDEMSKSQENRKVSSGLRKISPGNIARMLKERKSQLMLIKDEDSGKENKPSTGRSDSPPMSTPGRLGLQMRSGNGRLRKRGSEAGSSSKDQRDNASKLSTTPGRNKGLDCDNESQTDRIKVSLSARLSRPFNMDVPESNRPFDSIYLGKGEMSNSASGTRLSVAAHSSQRGPGGYGGLGASPFDGEHDTALPDMALSQQASNMGNVKGGFSGIWNSKRIVSDFLKKRRARVSDSEEKNKEDSPAFV